MSNSTFCTRIFEPYYTYLHAKRQTGEQPELKELLDAIGYEHLLMTREEDFEKVYPIKTFFHRYKKYIAVLVICGNTCFCNTFINGIAENSFNMIDEKGKAKQFFRAAGNELTVIDFYSGKEIQPDYETAQRYIKSVLAAENELNAHHNMMENFKQRLNDIKKNCDVLHSTSVSGSYKSAVNLLISCMETTEDLFCKKCRGTLQELECFLVHSPKYDSYIKMFGLYVYAVNFAISHKRFLSKGTKALSVSFNQTLGKMRRFIAENEGIVDKYIAYMEMTRNERENLIYMLSEEQLITNGSQYVGDELFA